MRNKPTITLKDFLKLYTAIPIKFIDSHFKFYEMCDNNEFGIRLFGDITKSRIYEKIQSRIC